MSTAMYATLGDDLPWLLLQEQSHRIGNEYAAAISMISLAAARTPAVVPQGVLRTVEERLHGFACVQQALQRPTLSDDVDVANSLKMLCRGLGASRLNHRSISLLLSAESILLKPQQCWLLQLLVTELVINAAKHAFGSTGGKIVIAVSRVGHEIQCLVSDDGTSIMRSPNGCGIAIAKRLAMHLGGELTVSFEPRRTMASVCFPSARDVLGPMPKLTIEQTATTDQQPLQRFQLAVDG
jgi:two-component sensor histidine kinase